MIGELLKPVAPLLAMPFFAPGFKAKPAAGGGGGNALLDNYANVTGAWSMSRQLKSSYGGAFYQDSGSGTVATLYDQSGNGRNFTQATATKRPAIVSTGNQNRAAARFDGTDDDLRATALSTLITASDGYVVASAIVRAVTTNSTTAYTNDDIFMDAGAYMGFHVKTPSAGNYEWMAYNWDGNHDATTPQAFSLDTAIVAEWRHTGGTLYGRLNLGTEQSVASGNTQSLANPLSVSPGYSSIWTQLDVFEMVAFNVVPSATERDALAQAMLDWVN